ncbi:MAG: MliC family protein, partial [Thermomonas sp.]
SGSGARYVGSDLEWWTKGSGSGSEGTLLRHQADGTSGEIVESCKAI